MKERESSLEVLSEEVLQRLEAMNYADATVAQYRKAYCGLIEYAGSKGKKPYSLELSRSFLLDRFGVDISAKTDKADISSKTRSVASKLRILDDYYLHGVVISHPNGRIKTGAMISDVSRELLCGYIADCEMSEQSAYGIDSRRGRIRRFLAYLDSCGKGQTSSIDALVILDHVKTLLPRHEKSISADLVALRSFLRWLYRDNKTEADWSLAVPKANRYNYLAIPSV